MSNVSKGGLAFLLAVSVLGLAAGQAQAISVPADIVFAIDVSGSMGDDIAQIKLRIDDFNDAMIANSIDAQYGLATFGNAASPVERLLQDITDFATFKAVLATLGVSGGTERGSLVTQMALDNFTFRAGAVKNFILVTDEDDDSDGDGNVGGPWPTVAALNADLKAEKALFNFIGVPGTGNTNSTYGLLAADNGGSAFSILAFRADPDPFFANFINTKVKEIQEKVIPEPMTMGALFMGVVGLAGYVRRRRAA